MGPVKLLHVYDQEVEHGAVWVVGNVDGLLAFRNAIDAALKKEKGVGQAEVMVADGEGFAVCVVCEDSDWQGEKWQQLLLPYKSASAMGPLDRPMLLPWEVGRWAEDGE